MARKTIAVLLVTGLLFGLALWGANGELLPALITFGVYVALLLVILLLTRILVWLWFGGDS